MRILHYYDKTEAMVSQHVKVLTDHVSGDYETHSVTEPEQARTLLKGAHYDILHLHGCWRNSSWSIVNLAFRQGTRLVLTPHGELEPWVQEEHRWKEKLPKRLLYQRSITRRAYAVIIQGRMEQECMQQLGWNPRTVIIRNAVITSSTTPVEMARQTVALYRKVMDSNPLALMDKDTYSVLRALLSAGITGDKRWVYNGTTTPNIPTVLSADQWRLLLCYAHQEQVTDTLRKGCRVLQLDAPDIDASQIDYFVPDGLVQAESIQQTIGYEFASENDRLLATFRYLRRLVSSGQLGVKHLVELNRELREHSCEEEALSDTLQEHHLLTLASRLMQLTYEQTGLTEGFMPVPPINDRTTRRLRQALDDHLRIS